MSLEVVNNFASAEPAISNAFYSQYFLNVLQDVFFVLTDTDHKSGFKLQSIVLARMFQLVDTDAIQTPLFDPATAVGGNANNSVFVREFAASLLTNAFPHLQPYVLKPFFHRNPETDRPISQSASQCICIEVERIPRRQQQIQASTTGLPHPTKRILRGQRRVILGREGGGDRTESRRGTTTGDEDSRYAQTVTDGRQGRGHIA